MRPHLSPAWPDQHPSVHQLAQSRRALCSGDPHTRSRRCFRTCSFWGLGAGTRARMLCALRRNCAGACTARRARGSRASQCTRRCMVLLGGLGSGPAGPLAQGCTHAWRARGAVRRAWPRMALLGLMPRVYAGPPTRCHPAKAARTNTRHSAGALTVLCCRPCMYILLWTWTFHADVGTGVCRLVIQRKGQRHVAHDDKRIVARAQQQRRQHRCQVKSVPPLQYSQ